MTYIQPISSFITVDEDMARKSPKQVAELAREASALALAQRPPITAPAGLTRRQANEYEAAMQIFERADVKLQGTNPQFGKLAS